MAIATNDSSATSRSSPRERSAARARSRCRAVQASDGLQTVIPRRICDGVFGMARTTAACCRPSTSVRSVAPATIERTTCSAASRPRSSRMTRVSICGLTASTTISASASASRLAATALMPWRSASASRRSRRGCEAASSAGRHRPIGEQAGDHRLGHDAGADDADPHRATCGHSISFTSSPTTASEPRSRRACSTSPIGAPARSSSDLRRPRQATAARHVTELQERVPEPEGGEPLLVLRADVARLVDRLRIVPASALRVAGREAQVADAPCLSRRLQRHAGLLEMPERSVPPDVRRPPLTFARRRAPWPTPPPRRRGGGRPRAPRRGSWPPARPAAARSAARAARCAAAGRAGPQGRSGTRQQATQRTGPRLAPRGSRMLVAAAHRSPSRERRRRARRPGRGVPRAGRDRRGRSGRRPPSGDRSAGAAGGRG